MPVQAIGIGTFGSLYRPLPTAALTQGVAATNDGLYLGALQNTAPRAYAEQQWNNLTNVAQEPWALTCGLAVSRPEMMVNVVGSSLPREPKERKASRTAVVSRMGFGGAA